jgi:uncharacterized RDD family membrane protein YckC
MSTNPYAPPSARVGDTGTDLADDDFEYAGFWMRFGAWVIDMVLLMVIVMPVMFAVYGQANMRVGYTPLGVVDVLMNYVLPIGTTLFFWRYKSATPGKLMLSLKVVDARTLGPMSWGQMIGRYFAYIVSMIPVFFGFFWIGWDAHKQGWHDKLAGTYVIRVYK